MDITHACHLLYIQIARQSFLLADQERRTGGAGRLHIAPPSATVTSGSGTVLGTSDTGSDKPSVLRAPPSTSPALMLLDKDPKLMQLRLVN